MKKVIRVLIFVIIAVIFGLGFWYSRPVSQTNVGSTQITGSINSDVYTNIDASTPYDVLVYIAKKNAIELTTKQYDFGIFVEGVGDQHMTNDKAWIYYVNGKSGEVAADKYELKQGDVVEWKYTTPIY